jgi:Transposase DDE domain
MRAFCAQATQAARTLTRHPQAEFEALQAARAWYRSAEGQERYQRRAGIEGTLSQGIRALGLRYARYRGLAKTRLQHVATAAAMNVDRIVAWLDERPRAKTRTSRFATLAPACGVPEDAPSSEMPRDHLRRVPGIGAHASNLFSTTTIMKVVSHRLRREDGRTPLGRLPTSKVVPSSPLQDWPTVSDGL